MLKIRGLDMDAALFGKRLKEMRTEAGLTQMALAKMVGLSQKAVSSWEKDQREPSLANAVALAQALGVEITDFLKPPKKPRKGRGAK